MITCALDPTLDRDHFGLPVELAHLDGFVGPLALVEAKIALAYEAEAVLCGWRPSTAAVIGTSARGLLTALALRLRGLEVTLFCGAAPTLREATLAALIGVSYRADVDVHGFDIVLRATGTRVPSSRGILSHTLAGNQPIREHVNAAIRDIIAGDTRYPGWLSKLSRMV